MKKYSRCSISSLIIWLIRGSMIFLTFLVLSNPAYEYIKKSPLGDKDEIMLVLDISKSMLADDISPSRLDRAKDMLLSFLHTDSQDRFGLIIFAGKAFSLTPPTDDYGALRDIISHITTDTIRQNLPGLSGTNIGDALLLAAQTGSGTLGNRTIILVTDGRANIGIDPIVATQDVSNKKIKVYTIGVGASSGTILSYLDNDGKRQYFYDEKGEKLRADIDEDMLQKISQTTGGYFYRATDAGIFENISTILSQTLLAPVTYEYQKSYQSLTLPLVFLLIILGGVHAFLLFLFRKN